MKLRRKNPLDYRFCDRDITVYHREPDGTVIRTYYERAFLEHKKVETTDKTGTREANSFLCVIPGAAEVFPDDRIVPGEGPIISTPEEWADLIPSIVPECVVVKYVDPKYWQGEIVHVEAGG